MKKITNILLLVLLAAVIVLAAAVIYLYQRDGSPSSPVSGTPSASQSESITVGTPAPSGGEAEGGDSSGDTNGPEVGTPAESGGEDAQAAVTELRCSAALGAVKIVEGAEFGLSEGSEAECEAYIEDNAYVVSASTTQDIPIVVTVPEGITFEQVTLTASGGNLTVEGIDTEALSTSCTQGAIYYSGRLDGSADVEHLQGQTVLQLEGASSDYNFELEYSLGHIQVGDLSLGGPKGSRSIDNGSEKTIQVYCTMGDVSVLFQ
ncbi:hypothetical protein WMO64_07265 [Pseudoflavonifractor sp. CLA-AP-H29]|uniref:Adhesin domain-containing protein n=1 Tax=Pseudoflavonifractor intestinihominis TaxID=3133171 RepID=A0ABV1E965_9FIRM